MAGTGDFQKLSSTVVAERQAILTAAMPGSFKELAERTGFSIPVVKKMLTEVPFPGLQCRWRAGQLVADPKPRGPWGRRTTTNKVKEWYVVGKKVA